MKTKKQERTVKRMSLIVITMLFYIILTVNAQGLTINAPTLVVANQNQEINFDIEIKNNQTNTTLTKNITEGELVKINDKYEFTWIANYPEKGFIEIIFAAQDNETTTTTKTTIAKPPIITGYSNINTNNDKVEISIETDIDATCKYDTNEKTYNNLAYTLQKNAEGLEHTGLTPTLTQGKKTIYIICKSNKGAETSTKFDVDVNLKPTAEIKLKPPSPLKAGIIEIEVVTSEDLLFAPELKYFFDDDASPRSITLTGSNNRWSGFIVIQETDKRRIGTFTFKGVDKTNLEGTEITSGKIFIVDNSKPSTVSSITGTIEEDRIKIEWRYLEEDSDAINEYRIYKRIGRGGVDYTDYITTTKNNYYYDTNVEYEEAYYYKVSAINHAGKEGELSKEVALTFMPQRTEQEERGLSAVLRVELNNKISQTDKILLDIDLAESYVQSLTSQNHQIIIQELEILAKIVAARNKINNIKKELEALENKDLSASEFDIATNSLLDEAYKEKLKIPKEITIIDATTYQEATKTNAREIIIKHLIKEEINTTSQEAKQLIDYLEQIQENYITDAEYIRANIIYEEEITEISLIKKTITTNEEEEEITILEHIPINKQIIYTQNPTNHLDDIVMWGTHNLPKTIMYYVLEDLSVDEFKNTKTYLIKEQEIIEHKNKITALATKPQREGTKHPLLVPLIIGFISVVFLSIYYFKPEDTTILEMIPYKKIMKTINTKKDDSHRKLNLEKPPEIINEIIHEKKREEKTNKEDIAQDIKEHKETSKEIIKESNVNENDEVLEVLSDIKEMVEDVYEQGDLDSDLKYLIKAKKIRKQLQKPAPKGKEFILQNGEILKNLKELKDSLYYMSDEVFNYHVNREKNDFYNWAKDVFGFNFLAQRIRNVKNKKELLKKLKF
jgi:hypothetical protein